MIRVILAGLYVGLFLILSTPLMVIEWLVERKDPKRSTIQSTAIVSWAFRCVCFLAGTTITVKGLEHIPKDKACLFVGNHRSYFDVVTLHASTPVPFGYVAKVEFLKVPLIRHWMIRINCLFLDRSTPRKGLQMVLDGVQKLKAGNSIFIFPEGTRNDKAQMLPFKEGSVKMAEKAKAPIIPVALTGTREIFENHIPFVRKSHVTITYCEPIYPDLMERKEKKFLGALVQERIQHVLDQNNVVLCD